MIGTTYRSQLMPLNHAAETGVEDKWNDFRRASGAASPIVAIGLTTYEDQP
jgi:hypothetical protein